MLRIKEAVIVEGKYDKIKLSSLIDALIIETNGFGIFKDRQKRALIQRLAKTRGILVITDSDGAGFVIRNHLAGLVPPGTVKHAYIPELRGKEARKEKPSKEGLLGVEGVPKEVLLQALSRAGVLCEDGAQETCVPKAAITKGDLYEAGLIGSENSAARRQKLLAALQLPQKLSTNGMLSVLNFLLTREEFWAQIASVFGISTEK